MNYDVEMQNLIKSLDHVPSLLLHSCCAPCSSSVIERLSPYFDITILYYNPNIEPLEEYMKRKEEQKRLIGEISHKNRLDFIDADYDNEAYHEMVKGLENAQERGSRCYLCYKKRIEYTKNIANKLNYEYFGTTLSLSPYKVSDWINEIGLSLEKDGKAKFLIADFKKRDGYKRSIELSRKYNLYRQDYCGCIYSQKQ